MDHAKLTSPPDRDASFAAESDYGTMYNIIFGHSVAQMARCAALFSFADHLAHGSATAEKIAEAEGLDADATFRLMRACAAFGLMTYDKNTGFSATPLLNTLRKDDPRSLRALAVAQGGRGHWGPWGQFSEAIKTGEPQANAALGSSVWEYYATPAGAEEAEAFSQAVGGLTGAFMLEAAPLIDTRSVGFAVDVGGATGSLIHALMKENPSLHGAVLDLPRVAADATKAAEALGLQDRLLVIGGDFLVEIPSADLYLMKHILHDWADEACISILRNCRRAIKPHGRIVLIEIAMDEINPSPYVTQIDLTMMVVLGAKERTLEQYKALLIAAGFRFTRITATSTPFSLIEAVAASDKDLAGIAKPVRLPECVKT
jgi:hypothetical protein